MLNDCYQTGFPKMKTKMSLSSIAYVCTCYKMKYALKDYAFGYRLGTKGPVLTI